jgi:hypothetical protein
MSRNSIIGYFLSWMDMEKVRKLNLLISLQCQGFMFASYVKDQGVEHIKHGSRLQLSMKKWKEEI